ncbi:LuxR C-terminal-related transcriptional regulator [Nostocoides sp. F2B08]|uniref:LuxR C-terminal-related transcriptional regulator n=1 Tax=Nostocoides sp. F2B08 TaxID=2653936 RepID=UPI00186ADEF5|nr:LuxR C-terminal-related transcriptional regulator [Tetrasphaera sp. F2B08]
MAATPAPVGFHGARLTTPDPGTGVVSRRRVEDLLDQCVRRRALTVVTGAGGSGKTYAVAMWARAAAESPEPLVVAWASLDRADRDPHRFWQTVVGALQRVAATEVMQSIAVPSVPTQAFVDSMTSALAHEAGHLVLVLDDVHELAGSDALDALEALVPAMPPAQRLVLVSRHDPPLHLHRLRLADRLGEIRGAELAFSRIEARELLKEHGLCLDDEALDHLMNTTEGWAAGLRLAMMALNPEDDPSSAVARFDGRHTLVSGYLLDEVVAGLGENRAEFLLRTCVVDRVCASLAGALTGDETAGVLLESLVRDNVLVSALNSGWYRYHPMLLETLRMRLRVASPSLVTEQHLRAQVWFEEEGEWLEALRHAVVSGDHDRAVEVALRSASVLMFSPDRVRLGQILGALPVEEALDPESRLCQGLVAYSVGDTDALGTWVARAATGLREIPEPRRQVATLVHRLLETAAARRAGDPDRMYAAACDAETIVRANPPSRAWSLYAGLVVSMRGVAELWLGRAQEAKRLLTEAVIGVDVERFGTHAQISHGGLLALSTVSCGLVAEGRATAERVLAAAQSSGWIESYESGAAWLTMAIAHLQAVELIEAEHALMRAQYTGIGARDPFLGAVLALVAGRHALTSGDVTRAQRALGTVDRWAAQWPRLTIVGYLRGALASEIALAAASPQRAAAILTDLDERSALERYGRPRLQSDPVSITRGHVYLAIGEPEHAREAVAAMLETDGSVASEAWVVEALAQDRLRHDASALAALARAIEIGAAGNAVQGFVRPNERITALLRRHLTLEGAEPEFVARVLDFLDRRAVSAVDQRAPEVSERTSPSPISLTERELSVLAYLPTLSTNPEIADELNISVNTVKQHLKTINRKLGVNSRREAVRVARRLGLLTTRS